jgi:hypothetical protein
MEAHATRDERHGVRVGMAVLDARGKRLGKVTRCDAWGFEVEQGFFDPKSWVIRYDEVLEARDGELVVARSEDALFELAAGSLPHTWPRYRPPEADGEILLPTAPAEGDVEGALTDSAEAPQTGAATPARPRAAMPNVAAGSHAHG